MPRAAVLEKADFKIDLEESTRKAKKCRRGNGEIVMRGLLSRRCRYQLMSGTTSLMSWSRESCPPR